MESIRELMREANEILSRLDEEHRAAVLRLAEIVMTVSAERAEE